MEDRPMAATIRTVQPRHSKPIPSLRAISPQPAILWHQMSGIMAIDLLRRISRDDAFILHWLPDTATHVNRIGIPSASSTRMYIVSQKIGTSEWGCSCPIWKFKKEGQARHCKHLSALAPILGLKKPRPPAAALEQPLLFQS